MLNKLRSKYGLAVATHQSQPLQAFPELEELARASESELRAMGFGYR